VNRSSSSSLRRVGAVISVIAVAGGLALMGVALASQRIMAQPVKESLADPAWASRAEPGEVPTKAEDKAKALVLTSSEPTTLDIPAIAVHSVVRQVGRTPDGALETPVPGPFYNDAAWYRHSPTPGSLGPAVLLGHVDSASDGPSVFYRLGELSSGDEISVTRADGSVAIFVVDEVKRYAKDDFPTELVYGDLDHAGLRILTCGGDFDETTGHYLDNIVVFASLKESR
jgi:hypothetical protein